MNRYAHTLIFLCCGLWLSAALAETYRWVDENGVTIYSQTPPPAGTANVERVKAPAPPARGDQEAWKELDRQWQEMQDRADSEKERSEKQQADSQLAADQGSNCEAAKHNLEVLQSSNRKLIRTPDGVYRRLTPEERQKQIEEARKEMEESCK